MSRPHPISLRAAWRLGGILLLIVAGSTLAAAPLVEGELGSDDLLLGLVAAAAGATCLWVPWQRIREGWLAAIPALAIVLIAVAAVAVDEVMNSLYVMVALYVALTFSQRTIVAFGCLILAALVLPFAYSDQPAKQVATWLLVVGPAVAFIAGATGLLMGRLHTSRETYRQLAAVDGLTGVGNYRALMERLDHEVRRHRRRGREFTVLTLDLDGFKSVNDTQGHLVGDAVLTTVASMLDVQVRTEDGVFRQGGDEFCVVAPETDERGGVLLAGRILKALHDITTGEVRLSATMGQAVYPQNGSEPSQLLEAADRDLLSRRKDAAGTGPQPT
jgi:diguanylate cyclase (GGDEF)-like protein